MSLQNEPTSFDSSSISSQDLNDVRIVNHHDLDLEEVVVPSKPHFLDYDAVPPPGFEEDKNSLRNVGLGGTSKLSSSCMASRKIAGENLKIDKRFERDGEISDYELAASGYTKKEFTQDDNNIAGKIGGASTDCSLQKKKHFLDENPIPPDYMIENDSREHRSLDRNFERQDEYENMRNDRKHSLDRNGHRHSVRRMKEPSYTLSRFIESDLIVPSSSFSAGAVGRGGIGSTLGTWPAERVSDNPINYSSMPPGGLILGSELDCNASNNLGPKVECVYSLLSMLGSHDAVEMSTKFLELSRTNETCATLRRSGCIPLLVQMMHSDTDDGVRKRAAMALHNVVYCHPDDKVGRREAKVLRLIEQIMDYCNFLKTLLQSGGEAIADDTDRHPLPAISSLMKVSFDEEHRHAMCQLGALQAIASLVHLDHAVHGPRPEDQCCNSLRRYALMALTNLTFGDGNNKALLCANKDFMEALVAQLDAAPDDLLQVTASVLRNLSWRADSNMKSVLNEIGTVTVLAKAAMKNRNENTLKAILSALWNLSAHCSTNKAEFCAVEHALAFIVDMLTFEGPSKTLKIIENAGGILRNVSSHIAVREDYRKILRQRNCLGILLQQLKSESLTVVSNSCGTLWNLSARCPEDQKFLWDNGAVPMLRSLIHSKHKMISEGSSAALKNLLNFRPGILNHNSLDPIAKSMGLKELPTLNARKQKALEQELVNQNLSETCDNLDAVTPPKETKEFPSTNELPTSHISRLTRSAAVSKSESRDSILSAKSDSVYEKIMRGNSAPSSSMRRRNLDNDEIDRSIGFPRRAFEENVDSEQPIDYSVKYSENTKQKLEKTVRNDERVGVKGKQTSRNYSTYQETDLDQPTDFSLRYAENQVESDMDEKPQANNQNEIILILEDSVKCYQTEDTPYVISNAASVSDLRKTDEPTLTLQPKRVNIKSESNAQPTNNVVYGLGSYTPEKPINYCEEGTPGYFSRYESLSSLEESPQNCANNANVDKSNSKAVDEETDSDKRHEKSTEAGNDPSPISSEDIAKSPKQCGAPSKLSNLNSAQETPLMFSRRSSMDSLVEEAEVLIDDKSSVVSEFSRLASGIISPSEIPDSPTQSMPQSPRRNSNTQQLFSPTQGGHNKTPPSTQPLRSVFEDNLSRFQVENTPAQFSCATSLSNLSLDDEPKIATDSLNKEMSLIDSESPKELSPQQSIEEDENIDEKNRTNDSCAFSEGEEETNDDYLLATCINIGMNRTSNIATTSLGSKDLPPDDALCQYHTEDTPAFLSKVGSNSNLSLLSISTNKENNSDISSNTSEVGGLDLLEQCIRDGMQKPLVVKSNEPAPHLSHQTERIDLTKDPIEMMRRGGLPPYLPVKDEMNKFVVEDSPCNFSVVSALSNLTVGSERAGPANIKRLPPNDENRPEGIIKQNEQQKVTAAEDSLSSISIESEDDTNLLSQAIAAGCNRPKSNLGFNSNNKPLSSSQPIPTSSRTHNVMTGSHQHMDINDSFSSVDSSDSNDNQSKSLFEQCIRTGMNKQKRNISQQTQHQQQNQRTVSVSVSNPNLNISPKRSHLPTFSANPKTPLQKDRERQRDRERKDEQLLKECISTGMTNKNANRFEPPQIKPPSRHVRQVLAPTTEFNQRFVTGSDIVQKPFPQQHAFAANATTSTNPKNGETTSVAVLGKQHQREVILLPSAPSTAPDVEMTESPDGTNNVLKNHQQQRIPDHHLQTENLHQPHQNYNSNNNRETIGFEQGFISSLDISRDSINLSSELGLLEHSNEYPAFQSSNVELSEDSVTESSFEMEVSNEYLIERDKSEDDRFTIQDKHKDPDLMMKSVERLTHDFVSTAEYLRTANACDNLENDSHDPDSNSTVYEKKSGSNSNSNNTWNEDTCPNDISFPSVSVTMPVIASQGDDDPTTISDLNGIPPKLLEDGEVFEEEIHDFAEITPTNEVQTFEHLSLNTQISIEFIGNSQPNSLETETETLVQDDDHTDGCSENRTSSSNNTGSSGIQFKVGGEVQRRPISISSININPYLTSGPLSFDGTSSAMTNSTIIAIEAGKLAKNIMSGMSDSSNSLDLDDIRPPSCMESLSMSGCFEVPQSPQMSKIRKKSLPVGLMARRALGHIPGALHCSVESVNSSCNLDNIKPPSLMDELLDSMISVASIQSEIVDNSFSNTNYDTACSDIDDNTITLQSCLDNLLTDDNDSNGTPIPSDFSSAESTPRKGRNGSCNNGIKKVLTPKQKRRIAKDRFKTYTIAADLVLKENQEDSHESSDYIQDGDEILQIEISEKIITDIRNTEQPVGASSDADSSPSSIKRRITDPERFKTRTINYPNEGNEAYVSNHTYEFESFTSTEDDSDEMSSIRAMTKQFKYITPPEITTDVQKHREYSIIPIRSIANLRAHILGGDDKRTTLLKPQTTESDYNSMECDQNSETESCDQNISRTDDESSPQRLSSKPKILKQGDKDSGTDVNFSEDGMTPPTDAKSIRGRKKPAYVSPYRKSSNSNSNSRITSPKMQSTGTYSVKTNMNSVQNAEAKKTVFKHIPKNSQSFIAKTHVLINKANLTNKVNSLKNCLTKPGFAVGTGNTRTKSQSSIDQKVLQTQNPPKLERQGTFVKDEPTNAQVPIVDSLSSTPIKISKLPAKNVVSASKPSGIPQSPAKSRGTFSKLKIPIQKSASMVPSTKFNNGKGSIIPARHIPTVDKRKSFIGVRKSTSVPAVPQRSNSNASIRTGPSITTALRSDLPSTTPPSRSNSTLTSTKISQIGSRIAGIWKKVDDAKKVQQQQQASSTNTKLIRSSTFDNSPTNSGKAKGNTAVGAKKPPISVGKKGSPNGK